MIFFIDLRRRALTAKQKSEETIKITYEESARTTRKRVSV
jgi:hypothetical protein